MSNKNNSWFDKQGRIRSSGRTAKLAGELRWGETGNPSVILLKEK